jgi:thiol-disulfide isomerase/thioredoxin
MRTRLLFPVCFLFFSLLKAQEITVPLQVIPERANLGFIIDLPETAGVFYAPGDVKIESIKGEASCTVRVQDSEPMALNKNEMHIVTVRRGSRDLGYEVGCHDRLVDGKVVWFLTWASHYKAEGNLKVEGCSRLMSVTDWNGDGLFDSKDLNGGTMLGIDANGDGKISGKAEHVAGGEVFELCGKRWLLTEVNTNGDWLKLRESHLEVGQVGAKIPQFSLKLDNGESLDSRKLTGRWNVIDFWASWCAPCVEKFPHLRELGVEMGDRMGIYIFNVDEADRLAYAKQVIQKFDLPYPKGWSGQGVADPIWKIFGSMPDEHFGIPLYVLIDPENRVAAVTREISEIKKVIAEAH